MTTKNAYWRKSTGSASRATALLRLPTELLKLLNERKPEKQSLTSFINDSLLRGLGEEPLVWRHPMEWETANERAAAAEKMVAALVVDECGVLEQAAPIVISGLSLLNVEEFPPEFNAAVDGIQADVEKLIYGSTDGTLPEDDDLEW